jgi:hypothetical protein
MVMEVTDLNNSRAVLDVVQWEVAGKVQPTTAQKFSTALPKGTYTVSVQVRNPDGTTSQTSAAVDVTVEQTGGVRIRQLQ